MPAAFRVVQPLGRPAPPGGIWWPRAGQYDPHHNVLVTYNTEEIWVYRFKRGEWAAPKRIFDITEVQVLDSVRYEPFGMPITLPDKPLREATDSWQAQRTR